MYVTNAERTMTKSKEEITTMGVQLSWLECTPDKGEVPGSSPGTPTILGDIAQS